MYPGYSTPLRRIANVVGFGAECPDGISKTE